jgi:hypothetical protein
VYLPNAPLERGPRTVYVLRLRVALVVHNTHTPKKKRGGGERRVYCYHLLQSESGVNYPLRPSDVSTPTSIP